MHLFIYSENPEISDLYQEHSTYHPGDCGFDLFVPEDVVFEPGEKSKIVDLEVSCEAFSQQENKSKNICYYMYPRSSMGARTPLRLSNSVGIIDAGYRGTLKAILDNIDLEEPYVVEKGTRLLQLCSPIMDEITYEVVNALSNTSRGTGGLGSTGS